MLNKSKNNKYCNQIKYKTCSTAKYSSRVFQLYNSAFVMHKPEDKISTQESIWFSSEV